MQCEVECVKSDGAISQNSRRLFWPEQQKAALIAMIMRG